MSDFDCKENGFSIIELVVVLALLSVMMVIAVPTFGNIFANNALAEAANRFVSSAALARNEAISRNSAVVMCLLNDAGNNCDNDGQWESGWLIWADLNANNTLDAGEQIIASDEGLRGGYTLRAGNNQFTNRITYSVAGDARGDGGVGAEIFRLCDPTADTSLARPIHLNGVGRMWVNRDVGGVVACP